METKSMLLCWYITLLLCSLFVILSNHGTTSTILPHKSLKFYMKSRHRDIPRLMANVEDIRAGGIPNKQSFAMLVNISIGNPPSPQLLIMDTGGETIWVQCASCTKCYEQTIPLYNPSKSSTYSDVKCISKFCNSPRTCNPSNNNCEYSLRYADNDASKGTLGTEKFTFGTSNDELGILDNVVFGCGIENYIAHENGGASGVLGLRAGGLSLTSQKGHKFSYCIGDLNDHSYPYNQLIIGDGAILEGYSTPLEVYYGNYYLTLEGISIGGKLLNINPMIFQRSPLGTDGGVVIDSGATFTIIPRAAYDMVKEEVISIISFLLKRRDLGVGELLCYYGLVSRDMVGFPPLTFHFADGADLGLVSNSLFVQHDSSTVCLAIAPLLNEGPSLIGIMAQQSYNVGYDPDDKKLYLNYVECSIYDH